ncbi:Phospholipase D1, partial [Ceratobasidium sp. 392]
MPSLAEVISAARDAEKENTKRLPDIAERPPSPNRDESQPQEPQNVALGALGGSFPRSWALQHPATRASFSKPPRPGSYHPKLEPVKSADPATATDPFHEDFRDPDGEFRGAFQYNKDDSSTPTGRKPKRDSWLPGFNTHPDREKDKSRDADQDEQLPEREESEAEAEPEHQEGGIWERWIAEPFRKGFSEPDEDPQSPKGTATGGTTPHVSRQNTAEGPRQPPKTVRAARSLPQIRDRAKSSRDTSNPNVNGTTDPRAVSQSRRGSEAGGSKWAILKPKIKTHVAQQHQQQQQPASGVAANVTVTDELLMGGLGVLLLQMFFERDDQDRRRVPILLHHLKIRVSDSINPLNGRHAVFRIECEYANGAARWVIYRQLRDFISLHGHYRVASVYLTRDQVLLPEFPKTSLPYFKFLKKEGREKGTEVHRTDFAKLQREALENYLIGVIKAVMFRADANRLFRFFEISALSIALAQRGGIQGKAGYLRVLSSNMSRKAAHTGLLGRKRNHEPKWWLVRESYLVAVEDPGELQIFDVFLLDSDFTIERPVRYYRQGLSFLHGTLDNDDEEVEKKHTHTREIEPHMSKSRAIKQTFRSIGHSAGRSAAPGEKDKSNGQPNGEANPHARRGSLSTGGTARPGDGLPAPDITDMISSSESSSDEEDPATAANETQWDKKKKGKAKDKANLADVSQHTFYIQNSQTRLKLVAKNEREMVQWIVSMERMASQSHWTGKNRFDSFAPIRLNVAAQWLVD